MKTIDKIKKVCTSQPEDKLCDGCPFNLNHYCLFDKSPNEWDIDLINKIIEKEDKRDTTAML